MQPERRISACVLPSNAAFDSAALAGKQAISVPGRDSGDVVVRSFSPVLRMIHQRIRLLAQALLSDAP